MISEDHRVTNNISSPIVEVRLILINISKLHILARSVDRFDTNITANKLNIEFMLYFA